MAVAWGLRRRLRDRARCRRHGLPPAGRSSTSSPGRHARAARRRAVARWKIFRDGTGRRRLRRVAVRAACGGSSVALVARRCDRALRRPKVAVVAAIAFGACSGGRRAVGARPPRDLGCRGRRQIRAAADMHSAEGDFAQGRCRDHPRDPKYLRLLADRGASGALPGSRRRLRGRGDASEKDGATPDGHAGRSAGMRLRRWLGCAGRAASGARCGMGAHSPTPGAAAGQERGAQIAAEGAGPRRQRL